MKEVVVYTGPSCVKCDVLKKMLDESGIKYITKNVMNNISEAKSLGVRSVPTTIVLDNGVEVARLLSTDLEGIKGVLNAD